MPQRYTLRLGDGTVLSVDLDGLKSWAGDDRAFVKTAGSHGWRPLRELLAEEESAARLARALVPPPPRQSGMPGAEAEVPRAEPEVPRAEPEGPPAAPTPIEPAPTFGAPPAVVVLPRLQVLADDLAAGARNRPSASGSDDGMPIIRMKPLEDEPPRLPTWPVPGGAVEAQVEAGGTRSDRLEGPLLTVLETFGVVLSRCLAPLAPLVAGIRLGSAEPLEPRRAEPLERPQPPPPSGTPEPWPVLPREPVATAPPPISELPVLRFVDSREPPLAEDVYDGPETSFAWRPLWIWTRRLVALGVLAALGTWAFLERDTWFPRAGIVGDRVFTEIDQQVVARQRSEEQRQALAEAASRLPGLAGDTIQLFFSRSPRGVVEASEVFQLSREATDRGRGALAPGEAEELRELEREAVGALRATERERVRDYERTRARRVIFPFENPHVMDLFAQGVRALPSERRERLQALTHKAVVAGIDVPEPAAPSGAR